MLLLFSGSVAMHYVPSVIVKGDLNQKVEPLKYYLPYVDSLCLPSSAWSHNFGVLLSKNISLKN